MIYTNTMSIVIDGSIYFDRMYRKYLQFRKPLRDSSKAFLMNPISMAIDYICYVITHLEILLKKYSFRVIYFNITHKISIYNRSYNKQRSYDNRLSRSFKDMIRLMETSEISGTYIKYHEYFKNTVKSYKIKDIDERKTGYDYENSLPKLELEFIREALNEQTHLTPNDVYYCNRIILSMLTNCRVIYTDSSNIDYMKYHNARFIRNKNWRHYKRRESVIKPEPITKSLYEHFNETRKYPLIDCCQTNSYDMFILTDDPFKFYVKNDSPIFLDTDMLEDYVEVIDLIEERENESSLEGDNYTTFIESIEPTEITEADINIIIESIIKRWQSFYKHFDIKKLKISTKPPTRSHSVPHITEYKIDISTEIV